jgi:hypothetical protein
LLSLDSRLRGNDGMVDENFFGDFNATLDSSPENTPRYSK